MTTEAKIKLRSDNKVRVLIADHDGHWAKMISTLLTRSGFEVRVVENFAQAKKQLLVWPPKILLVDLLLSGGNAFDLLQFAQTEKSLKDSDLSVLVTSGHKSEENQKLAYLRGARDYLVKPILPQDLLARIVFHCRRSREFEMKSDLEESKIEVTTNTFKVAEIVLSQTLQNAPAEEILHKLTRMIEHRLKCRRCSIIQYITQEQGTVLASSDKANIAGFELQLAKYPEILLSVNKRKTIVIDNLSESQSLRKIKSQFKNIEFNGLVVAPLTLRGQPFGVISVRMPADPQPIKMDHVRFIEYVAKLTSLYLGNLPMDQIGRYGLRSA
jgi:twitching motility two-component system response regulator PilH